MYASRQLTIVFSGGVNFNCYSITYTPKQGLSIYCRLNYFIKTLKKLWIDYLRLMEYLYYKVPSNSCLIPDDGLRYTMSEKSQVYCNQSQLFKLAEKSER